MRRQQLSEVQIATLFDPPTDRRELVRHYTLSADDLAAVRCYRGNHNRLGYALMLGYLRYPGRPLKTGERPPGPLIAFVAEQIDALPASIEEYLAAERNRQRHTVEAQERLAKLKSGWACVLSAGAPPLNLQAPSSRKRSKLTVSSIWRNWSWRNAGGAALSPHLSRALNASASSSAFRDVGKSNGG